MVRKTVLFEGDSWFAYPQDPIGPSNIYEKFKAINDVRSSEDRYKVYFQPYPADAFGTPRGRPLSKNGDTIKDMASDKNIELWKILKKSKVWALIISGGGNDIIKWLDKGLLKTYAGGAVKTKSRINIKVLNRMLGEIEEAYTTLMTSLQRTRNPSIHVLAHNYTFLKPSGVSSAIGFGLVGLFKGPWLRPSFEVAGYPSEEISTTGQAVCDYVMQQFSQKLADLEGKFGNFRLVRSQDIPKLSDCLVDELHLNHTGCHKVAQEIISKLDNL